MHIRSIRALLSATLPAILFALVVLSMPAASFAQMGVAIAFGPPPIPVYEQPLCPGEGYLWVPGYWAYDYDFNDYYWVPGTWVMAPEIGFLWTPGYWGWEGGRYRWWDGYWGPHVGFYGGINYGFGYFGYGFEGGRWDGGRFFYNRAVMNINVTNIRNVYDTTVGNRNENRVSFNGGNGGINARPRPEEEAAAHERHIAPIAEQNQHMQAARGNPQMRASANMGRPAIAATVRPGEFSGRGVMAAREAGGSYNPPARGGNKGSGGNIVHPRDLPPVERGSAPNTGNPKVDQRYQQQQEKMLARQNQERDKLQQQQEKEHQQLAKQNAGEERKQQVEQKHQQQTQQLQQKHDQERQQLQQKQQPANREPGKK